MIFAHFHFYVLCLLFSVELKRKLPVLHNITNLASASADNYPIYLEISSTTTTVAATTVAATTTVTATTTVSATATVAATTTTNFINAATIAAAESVLRNEQLNFKTM
jgi:hypothetical protein